MRNRSIYAKLFPKMKDTPGPLGNTGRPEPDAMSMGPGPEDVQQPAARFIGVPKPPASAMPEPASAAVTQYTPETTPTEDPEEQRRLAELTAIGEAAAAGNAYVPSSEAASLQAKADKNSYQADELAGIGEAAKKGVKYEGGDAAALETAAARRKQIEGLDGPVDYSPSAAPMAAAPVDYAKKEADLEQQTRAAMLRPDEMRPGSAKQQKRADEDMAYQEKLKASLPYENPTTASEKAANRKAELRFKADNPRNEDHGIKGFIRETLQNFFHGLSMAQGVPGISIPQALALGGGGAGAGMLNRSWNEQRMAEQQLPGAMKDADYELGQEDKRRTMDARDATVGIRQSEVERKRDKDLFDADIRTKTFNWKKEDREQYMDLLRDRELYKVAGDQAKLKVAQQRLDILDKRYKVLERQGDAKLGLAQQREARVASIADIKTGMDKTKVLSALDARRRKAIADGEDPTTIDEQIEAFKQKTAHIK